MNGKIPDPGIRAFEDASGDLYIEAPESALPLTEVETTKIFMTDTDVSLTAVKRVAFTRQHAESFLRKVSVRNGCWKWTGTAQGSYGWCRDESKKKNVSAHRHSYEMFNGPIPDGLLIRHTCNNSTCVNPNHLSVGTHAENMADKVSSGRGKSKFTYRGELHWKAGLSDSDVSAARELYAEGTSVKDIASALGRPEASLHAALVGRTRTNAPGPLYTGGKRQPTATERARGERHALAVLTNEIVVAIRRRVRAGESYRSLAVEYGTDKSQISKAARGETWAHVTEPVVTDAPARAGLTPERRREIREAFATGVMKKTLCDDYGISLPTLNKVLS